MMKKLLLCLLIFTNLAAKSQNVVSDSISYDVFGKVSVYKGSQTPKSLILFISGDGGWNSGVVDMAKALVPLNTMVAGINIIHYLKMIKSSKSECYYPASDFENLSLFLQKKYKFPQYVKPVLIGYSSGATLAYAALAQAPENTFAGAISLGFCPDIEIDRPLCKGNGLTMHVLKPKKSYYIEKVKNLSAPFFALQGTGDQVCPFQATEAYLKDMPNANLVKLTRVGHGFGVQKNWMPQFKASFQTILAHQNLVFHKPAESLPKALPAGLPIIMNLAGNNSNPEMAFFISGDGGWTDFDDSIAKELARSGISSIGLDAQKYFWNQKTPEQTAADVSKILSYYSRLWNKTEIRMVGYSFGADVMPFIVKRLPENLKSQMKSVTMLSPSETSDFEIHVADMLGIGGSSKSYNVISETKSLKEVKTVCVFGDKEDSATAKNFKTDGLAVKFLEGNHHFDKNFPKIVNMIRE